LPPAQPAYIFRGHSAQIHSTAFIRKNTRLVTGDADGWIVIWSIAIKRPVTVWRAHEGSILGVSAWGDDKLITCVLDLWYLHYIIRCYNSLQIKDCF